MVGWLYSNAMEHIHCTPDLWESEYVVRWRLGEIHLVITPCVWYYVTGDDVGSIYMIFTNLQVIYKRQTDGQTLAAATR